MSPSSSSGAAVPEVLLGLGGNLGDPVVAIEAALDRLEAGGVRILRRSRPYRTAPCGIADQPHFVNLCAAGETALAPRALLGFIHTVEAALGRERRERWGPRPIDIDILAYGDERIDEPGLTIPHPRLTERAFVLVPLLDIAADRVIEGRSVRDWAATVDRGGIEPLPVIPGRAGGASPE
jgi:2-amino-4-hydroxy-6-hydroxymethyldihydropteridine diphosphokinase